MAVDGGRLLVRLEGRVWANLPLVSRRVLTIGREPSNDLALPDPRVSRRHAELRLEARGPILTDLGSSSGTFLETARLLADQPHMVAGGASFSIGPFTLTYVAPEQLEGFLESSADISEALPDGQKTLPARSPSTRTARPARPEEPTPRPPQGCPSRYLADLPALYQDSDFLSRYLLILESIWEPLEQRQDHIAMYFDPRTCPASFLPWLATWLGLSFDTSHQPSADSPPTPGTLGVSGRPVDPGTLGVSPRAGQLMADGRVPRVTSPESRIPDESRRRDLLAAAMDLYRWRGTRHGLERMIELCTGVTPHITDDPSDPYVFHVSLSVPPDYPLDMRLLQGLIEAHKPAHAGYTLSVTR